VAGEACEKGYGLAKIEKWHDEVIGAFQFFRTTA
jgi:hypothetical protein